MPLHRGKDSEGSYYSWGKNGHRYHYTAGSKRSRDLAKSKAEKQGKASHAKKGGTGKKSTRPPVRRRKVRGRDEESE